MSLGKEAYIRYKVINECLTNRFATYPTIFDIIDACENDFDNIEDIDKEDSLKIAFIVDKSLDIIKKNLSDKYKINNDKTIGEILEERRDNLAGELFKGIVD